jgi:hypothetical protein
MPEKPRVYDEFHRGFREIRSLSAVPTPRPHDHRRLCTASTTAFRSRSRSPSALLRSSQQVFLHSKSYCTPRPPPPVHRLSPSCPSAPPVRSMIVLHVPKAWSTSIEDTRAPPVATVRLMHCDCCRRAERRCQRETREPSPARGCGDLALMSDRMKW